MVPNQIKTSLENHNWGCLTTSRRLFSTIWYSRLFVATFTVILLTTVLPNGGEAVLTGVEQTRLTDITEEWDFGCRWLGGSESKLVCQCQSEGKEIIINSNSIPARDIGSMSISNCHSVRFNSNSISRMRNLRYIEIRDSTLHFGESSFLWEGYVLNNDDNNYDNNQQDWWDYSPAVPTLKVIIDRCNVKDVGSFAFQGKISEISVTNSVIENVQAFAWSRIRFNNNFQIINSRILNISPQSLKKFPTTQLTLDSVQFDTIPSRAFSEVIVRDHLLINNITANRIRSSAFTISGPKKTDILNNKIDIVEGGAFRLYTRGGVTVKNNEFKQVHEYAFKEISVELNQVTGRQFVEFTNNTITEFHKDSLSVNATSFDAKYSDITLKMNCDCADINRLFSRNDLLPYFSCSYNSDSDSRTLSEFKKYKCTVLASHSNLFIILGVTGIVLVLVIIALVLYFKRVHRCGSYGGGDATGSVGKEKSLGLIVPDGRTYRETELHVFVERTDLLTTDL